MADTNVQVAPDDADDKMNSPEVADPPQRSARHWPLEMTSIRRLSVKPLLEVIKELTSTFSNTVTRLQSSEAPPTLPIAPVVPKYRPLLCPETRRGCPFARTVRYLLDAA